MKLLSIKTITDGLKVTIKRFPFEILFALIGTISGIVLIEISDVKREAESWCLRLIMMADLGLLLSISASLYIESNPRLPVKPIVLKLAAALLAVLLIFILDPYYEQADRIRFVLLALSFHLLVSFAAFTVKGHLQGFWQFNKALFLRFLEGALYSVVLFAGISAALGAMNFLFAFKFEWDTFVILWTIIVGLFHTTFVLSGIPKNLAELDTDESYPKGLKVFTQYVLIPLATIYVAILLSYELKILVQWSLPKGLVSNLILCYAVFGILSILLVYPIRERQENKWIKTFARSFYFLLVPLIILLLLAVGARVFKYGITEWRYFLIVLAFWLLFITVYFLTSKKQNIKLIPISLCLLTLLTIYGPQSTFSIAKYSQQRVLVGIFKNNNAFKDGKLVPVDSLKISRNDGNRAVNTLNYLIEHHDLKSLQSYLPVNLDKVSDSLTKRKVKWDNNLEVNRYQLRFDKLDWVKKYLHLGKFNGYSELYYEAEVDTTIGYLSIEEYRLGSNDSEGFKTRGYDYFIKTRFVGYSDTTKFSIDGLKVSDYHNSNNSATLYINDERFLFDIRSCVNAIMKSKDQVLTVKDTTEKNIAGAGYILNPNTLTISHESKHYYVDLKINQIRFGWNSKKGMKSINYIDAVYLVKVK